ncbi:MAG: 3-deoxy-7-phosphoheptulonate synthase [Anaerolineales bacterium]|uniref:3-deoxy-7-phosphoheptulonate synthase n=1 Tax=Candidatus Villigracilis affinis TaxID=3140682 RepID=UPI002A1D43A3|nr:3-deoxy-7-phosphoheptulonate synthase [Anaerolineales bacterium]MBL0343915.1 3-deoxy-7-phosphoheptulonate synthase [Anaerolineales bacterium]
MMIIMKANATPQQVEAVIASIKEAGLNVHLSQGVEATIIGAIGETHNIPMERFESLDGVDIVQRITQPYKLASRQFHPEDSVISMNGFSVGGNEVSVIAGPCSVESRSQIIETAIAVKEAGASALRGGVFKPRTSPYSFQGLGEEGLELLAEAREKTGLPIVVEIMSQVQLDVMVKYVDVLQVGARNMQNFNLLRAIGESRTAVLLKRGLSATVEELLMSAEYILAGGNQRVMLCERGIRTFETSTRNTTDINAIPVLKNLTHLPVILDPSHSTGLANYVAAIARAGIAAGADGLIVEVHPDPAKAVSDGKQSLKPEAFAAMVKQVGQIAQVMGRNLSTVQGDIQPLKQGWA